MSVKSEFIIIITGETRLLQKFGEKGEVRERRSGKIGEDGEVRERMKRQYA